MFFSPPPHFRNVEDSQFESPEDAYVSSVEMNNQRFEKIWENERLDELTEDILYGDLADLSSFINDQSGKVENTHQGETFLSPNRKRFYLVIIK